MWKRCFWLCAVVPGLALSLWYAAVVQAEPITLKAFFRDLENARACEAAVVKRVELVGPGEVTVSIRLDPYRAAGKADNFPVRFGEIRNGRFQGWTAWPPFERGLGVKTTQGNRDLGGANPTDGLPVERVYRYRMEARSYVFDVSLGPPCLLQGGSGFRQWAQGSEVQISASSEAANTPGTPPVKGPSLAGRWTGYRGGVKVADCLIIEEGGALTFVILRNPEERSTGRWTGGSEVWAVDWGPNEKGRVSADGRRIDWANSYWVREGRSATPPPESAPVSLAGRWAGYRGGTKVADCSIRQDGANLTFIIHRNPEERSSGRFTSASEVWAVDWGSNERGQVSADGRRIDWRNSSYWVRVD